MLEGDYIEKLIFTSDVRKSEANSLSLFISANSFIFAISSKDFENVQQLAHLELKKNTITPQSFVEKVTFLLNNYQLSHQKFEKIIITLLNNDFTLVPEAYSNPNDLKTFLSFSSGVSEIKNPFVQTIKNVKFCYTLNQELIQYLENTFPQAIIKHTGVITINSFFSNASLVHSNLFLSVHDGLIELCAKEKNELLFYNVFGYETNEDILYYLLFMMDQFNLNPKQIKLHISGQIQTNDLLVLSIKKYIKYVNFVIHDSSLKLETELSKLPLHNYFTVLNQHLCE